MLYLILLPVFFITMLIYFRIADHYNIIDHPNERSSHAVITIRGGGIIFIAAAICTKIILPGYWYPLYGLLLIGAISFADDILTLSSKVRLLFHLAAVTAMFLYLNVFHSQQVYVCVLLYIMVIGVINMYNFMDGINGITGIYSLVVLGGLQYVNLQQRAFTRDEMIWIPMLACTVFLFFNFRKTARCFAGDVGSVTIAFWVIMLLLRLIFVSGNWVYILFLCVYGTDSLMTIAHRLILKQNIFKAHRMHFYQFLANENKVPHLVVSAAYALIQGVIILFVIFNSQLSFITLFAVTVLPLVIIYLLLKPWLMRAGAVA